MGCSSNTSKHQKANKQYKTLKDCFEGQLHAPHPQRLHSLRSTQDSFVRNLLDCSITGPSKRDALLLPKWRLEMTSYIPKTIQCGFLNGFQDLCFLGDNRKVVCATDRGVYTGVLDDDVVEQEHILWSCKATTVKALDDSTVVCASLSSHDIHAITPYGATVMRISRGDHGNTVFRSSTMGFSDLAFLSRSELVASERGRACFKWDLRASYEARCAYRFHKTMSKQPLDPVVSIHARRSENLLMATTLLGDIAFWDIRQVYKDLCLPIYVRNIDSMMKPESMKMHIKATALHPTDPMKMAFVGNCSEGTVAGLLEIPIWSASYMRRVSSIDEDRARNSFHPLTWLTEDTILTGSDKEALCCVHFSGRPCTDLRASVENCGVVDIPMTKSVSWVGVHPINKDPVIVCGDSMLCLAHK